MERPAFPVLGSILGSFAVHFGDHLPSWDHLRACTDRDATPSILVPRADDPSAPGIETSGNENGHQGIRYQSEECVTSLKKVCVGG